MSPKQPGSQFWGTGPELSEFRETMDSVEAQKLFIGLSQRIYGSRFDYSAVEFRSLNHPVTLTDTTTGETFSTTPYRHFVTEDGHGY
jgi:hypothetical protein